MKLWTGAKVLSTKLFSREKGARDYAGFLLAEGLCSLLYRPICSDHGRIWLDGERFFHYYRSFVPTQYRSADRKFMFRNLLGLVDHLNGDLAECGVYHGASAWLMCGHFQGQGKTVHLFDSFEGLSRVANIDGSYWTQGDLKADESIVLERLAPYDFIKIYKGWIPTRFCEVSETTFCFVHIDVDLYQPTLDSLTFFYPRMAPGGIILSDDYGYAICPGAKQAFDEFMADKPESIVHVPTGQCFVVKR
jgi:O-methyltransferase